MQQHNSKYDVAVVGGGIVGLAMAYIAARKGLSVAVFERHPKAQGATIRNFGMVWPIGQAAGTFHRAMLAREIWLELAQKAGFWANPGGSLHLAYHEDELHVLEEFVATTRQVGYQCQMLTPLETIARSNAVNPVGLEGALWSATEVNVDPREASEAIHRYLAQQLGVSIFYNTVITNIEYPCLVSGINEWKAEQIYVCSGADFETLYPALFAESGLTKCKLQMMRTAPQPNQWQLGPNLAAGLTLQHYTSFAHCESLQLLKKRFAREMGDYNRWGIHVLVSQTRLGELTIGDSHEYGLDLSPFDKSLVNNLILKYLKKFLKAPTIEIEESWHGIYAKNPGKTEYIVQPEEGVTIVNGLGGAGMTLSFGLAAELFEQSVSYKTVAG
ncbi:MAG: TIGR03364 family FAD-dependent oxidoreductase [Saprospiraceae bacterium]|nr:TIGR03364 family FAD-dependent oxidoreductase [Saprospiraceae bacterium]